MIVPSMALHIYFWQRERINAEWILLSGNAELNFTQVEQINWSQAEDVANKYGFNLTYYENYAETTLIDFEKNGSISGRW
ncbi:MAG: hypothetical protein ACPL1Y_01045 [Thermoplasmata archaeon]